MIRDVVDRAADRRGGGRVGAGQLLAAPVPRPGIRWPRRLWGPFIGPVISLLSFVCSIGNVPLAAVLWNGGISFGGVISFIFADLIIIPILVIYRKYYGTRMMLALLGLFYADHGAGRVPGGADLRRAGPGAGRPGPRRSPRSSITWNYTTILNIIFLLAAAALLARFFASGGVAMLRMMGGGPDDAGSRRMTTHAHGVTDL